MDIKQATEAELKQELDDRTKPLVKISEFSIMDADGDELSVTMNRGKVSFTNESDGEEITVFMDRAALRVLAGKIQEMLG